VLLRPRGVAPGVPAVARAGGLGVTGAAVDTFLGETPDAAGRRPWLTTTDHKRIALLTAGTALVLLFVMGAFALTMRAQLAQPAQSVVDNDTYNQLFTMHGSGMIYLVVTPIALALGLYLVPLQVGAPTV